MNIWLYLALIYRFAADDSLIIFNAKAENDPIQSIPSSYSFLYPWSSLILITDGVPEKFLSMKWLYGDSNFFKTLHSVGVPPHTLERNGIIISFKQKLSIVPKKLCFTLCPSALHLRSSSELAFFVNVIAMTPLLP